MLEINGLRVAYGEAEALGGIDLRVEAGELIAVVGANGAGKTTLVNAVARVLAVAAGTIRLDGADMTRRGPQEMCEAGVALIPEGRRLFTGMTVQENLEIGAYRRLARKSMADSLAEVYAMFPVLGARRRQVAGTLSGGQQQMVAIGRALMARPRLLLIDEPSLGLSPKITDEVFATIAAIHASGTAILLIEQSVGRALAVAQRAYVIELGQIAFTGAAAAIAADPRVRMAFLGGDANPVLCPAPEHCS